MEGNRFDLLARALGRAIDRRAGFRAAALALAAGAGVRLGEVAEAAPQAEKCLPNGRRCGKGSGKRGKPCGKCCSRHDVTQPNGRRRCACRPDGAACGNSSQCCTGSCTDRVCGGPQPLCIPEGDSCVAGGLACCGDLDCLGGACRATANCTATLEGAGCEFLVGPGVWNCGSQDLTGVNLNGCDLTSASFFNTNASGAQFAATILTGANFFDANVTDAVWGDTTCPAGVNSDDNDDTCCGQFTAGQTPTGCPVG